MASAGGVLTSDRGEVENEAYDEREQTSSGTTRRERARMIALDVTTFGLLFSLGTWLEVARPNQKYIQEDLLWRYSYPHKENTVPTVVVPIIAFAVPFVCMLLIPRRWNPHVRKERAIGGLCASVGLTWVITCAMKNIIGNIRPDFVARCWPDGKVVWTSIGVPNCSGNDEDVQQGRRSFPSGHTSMSFSGLVYCSLYLAAWFKIGREERAFGRWEAIWKLVVVLGPTFLAMFVGLTRIADYWHHWEDVLVGATLGTAFAYVSWIYKKPYARASSFVRANYSPIARSDLSFRSANALE